MPNRAQFFTTKPREIYFKTIEIHNNIFGTRRYVADQQFAKSFTLESDAPRNPGQVVEFQPASMQIAPLTQSDQPVSSLEIQLGRVGQQVKELFEQLQGQLDRRVTCIYREYRSGDTSAPINFPQALSVSSVNLEADSVSLTVEDDNPGGVVVARKYLPQDFPGLEVQL